MGDLRASLGRGNQHNFTNKKGGCLTNKYGGFKINYQRIWWFCQQTIDFTKKIQKMVFNQRSALIKTRAEACNAVGPSSVTSRMCANARADILA